MKREISDRLLQINHCYQFGFHQEGDYHLALLHWLLWKFTLPITPQGHCHPHFSPLLSILTITGLGHTFAFCSSPVPSPHCVCRGGLSLSCLTTPQCLPLSLGHICSSSDMEEGVCHLVSLCFRPSSSQNHVNICSVLKICQVALDASIAWNLLSCLLCLPRHPQHTQKIGL